MLAAMLKQCSEHGDLYHRVAIVCVRMASLPHCIFLILAFPSSGEFVRVTAPAKTAYAMAQAAASILQMPLIGQSISA
jgi:hypothetical protein